LNKEDKIRVEDQIRLVAKIEFRRNINSERAQSLLTLVHKNEKEIFTSNIIIFQSMWSNGLNFFSHIALTT